jgi:hypothetical protein
VFEALEYFAQRTGVPLEGPLLMRTAMLGRLLALSCISFFVIDYAAAQDSTAPAPEQSTTSERFQDYLSRTYGWQKMSWLAVDTGIDHLLHESEWGRGIDGYGCRYASGFGRRLINNSVEFGAVLVLRQDTRFRRSHRTGIFPRIRYAATHAFLATNEQGEVEPAYARFAGITGGALIAPAWRKHTLSAAGFGQDLAFSSLDQVQNSLLTEFSPDLQRLGVAIRKKLLRK